MRLSQRMRDLELLTEAQEDKDGMSEKDRLMQTQDTIKHQIKAFTHNDKLDFT